jgi:sporulation related protein
MITCPRCGEHAADGQEYCLDCGQRLVGPTIPVGSAGSRWIVRAALAAVVALAGGAAAVAATRESTTSTALTTAIGGFTTATGVTTLPGPSEGGTSAVADWPAGADGWTIVLASYPQTGGRAQADAAARRARAKKLGQVGVLDSSRYASLHPGYWVVFSGVYGSEAEATSALERARKVSRTAAVQHVVA